MVPDGLRGKSPRSWRTNTECVLEMIESGKRRFENQIFGFAFTTSSSAGDSQASHRELESFPVNDIRSSFATRFSSDSDVVGR
jgi:hypothetical protein